MTYRAPTQDIRFVLKELADLDGVLALPGFKEVSQDLVDAVLEENARFVEQAIALLNRDGATSPAKWSEVRVSTSPRLMQAFSEYEPRGWRGQQEEQEWGGQE